MEFRRSRDGAQPEAVGKHVPKFRHAAPLIGALLLPGFMNGCVSMEKAQRIMDARFKAVCGDCLETTRRNYMLPQFYGIRSADIRAADSELQRLFGVKAMGAIPRTTETMLAVFDRVSKIRYRIAGDAAQFPAQTLGRGKGDCDDKTIALALMINRIFPNSTRIIVCEFFQNGEWVGHAYLQIDLMHIPELKERSPGEKDLGELLTGVWKRHYKGAEEALRQVSDGIEYSVGNPEGMQLAPARMWLSLDATMKFPGGIGSKTRNTRLKAIHYPYVERLMHMERVMQDGKQGLK